MSLQPCSIHGTPVPGVKLATLFAAWHDETGKRLAYKLKLCAPCLTELMASLRKRASTDASQLCTCPVCGEDASTSLSPLYLTLYVPKQEGAEFALTTCTSCALPWRGTFQQDGILQPDRFANGTGKTGWEDFTL